MRTERSTIKILTRILSTDPSNGVSDFLIHQGKCLVHGIIPEATSDGEIILRNAASAFALIGEGGLTLAPNNTAGTWTGGFANSFANGVSLDKNGNYGGSSSENFTKLWAATDIVPAFVSLTNVAQGSGGGFNNGTLYVKVTAVDIDGHESAAFAEQSQTGNQGANNNQFNLVFNAADTAPTGVASYNVYFGTASVTYSRKFNVPVHSGNPQPTINIVPALGVAYGPGDVPAPTALDHLSMSVSYTPISVQEKTLRVFTGEVTHTYTGYTDVALDGSLSQVTVVITSPNGAHAFGPGDVPANTSVYDSAMKMDVKSGLLQKGVKYGGVIFEQGLTVATLASVNFGIVWEAL